MLQRFFAWYVSNLKVKPLQTNMITSALICAAGDALAQNITHIEKHKQRTPSETENRNINQVGAFHLDLERTVTMAGWGTLLAPPAFAWYKWLDTAFISSTPIALLRKVTFNVCTFTMVTNVIYFGYIKAVHHLPRGDGFGVVLSKWREKLETDFEQTAKNACIVWGAAHLVNFRFIPPHLRILYMNLVGAGWACYISIMGYRDLFSWSLNKNQTPIVSARTKS
jgi:hypothetical protein